MERQAKDGTIYEQIGQDEWRPITRTAKDGTVFKKVGQDAWAPFQEPEVTAGEKARAFHEGFAESASLGTLPYLKAGVGYVGEKAMEALNPDIPARGATYGQMVEEFKKQGEQVQEKAPGYATAGEVTGFFVPGVGAEKLVGKGLNVLSKSSKLARAVQKSGRARELYKLATEAKAAGNLPRAKMLLSAARADLAYQGTRLAAEGALIGAAQTPKTGFGDIKARAENALTTGLTGAAVPFALRGAGNILRGTGAAARKALGAVGGVSDDVIQRYLADPERIRGAQTFDELYEQVSGVVGRLGDDLDNSKVDYATAKAHLDDVAKGIKDSRIQGKEKALEEVKRAKMFLNETFKVTKENITRRGAGARISGNVEDAIKNLKTRVNEGSKEALDILGEAKGSVKLKEMVEPLQKLSDDLAADFSEDAVKAKGKIDHYLEILSGHQRDLSAMGMRGDAATMDFKSVRRFMKNIQEDVSSWESSQIAGGYSGTYDATLKTARRALDKVIKTKVPAYGDKMDLVAADTGLLNEVSKMYGKASTRAGKLQNVGGATKQHDLEMLRALAKKEGGELPGAIEDVVTAQRTLKSPTRLEQVRRGLPEAQQLRKAEMELAVTKRMARPGEIRKTIEQSSSNYRAMSAKAKLEEAKNLFNKFKTFGEQGAESKLNQVARGRQYATRQLQELSKLADRDFVEAVKAAGDAKAFTKSAFNGSRNVNFWGILGMLGTDLAKAGLGATAGGVFGGPLGAALGGSIGLMMDVYGPRVTKKILDGVIKIKGPITESAIMKMKVPANVRRDLIRMFRSAILTGQAKRQSEKKGNR